MPIGTGLAILGASALGAGASAVAGSKASKAAKKAAEQNNALLQANLGPYMDRGGVAGDRINALLGLGGDQEAASKAFGDWADSTGYQFQLKSGSDAIGTNKAANGLLRSGSTLKALTKYGQDLGSTYFGNYLNALGGQQSTGLQGATALTGGMSGNNDSAAAAKGGAAINTANQFNGLLGSSLNAFAYSGGLGSSYGKAGLPKIKATPTSTPPYAGFYDG